MKTQKRIAAQMLKCSPHRVHFDTEKLSDIKEAITKLDIRALIREGAITRKPVTSISRGRAREVKAKKQRGQRRGQGSRKGTASTRKGRHWITKIRSQRKLLVKLKEDGKIDSKTFRNLYLKAKGGFFRNVRHIKLYLQEQR